MFITSIRDIRVEPYGTQGGCLLDFGRVGVVVRTPADCDELIKAAVTAKTGMTAGEPAACGAWIATDGHRTWYCQYPPGHDGDHGPRPGEEPEPLPDEPVEFWPSLTGRALAGNPDGAA